MTFYVVLDVSLNETAICIVDAAGKIVSEAVLENKRLGGYLTLIRQSQQSKSPVMRTSKGPNRRDQTKHMFSVG